MIALNCVGSSSTPSRKCIYCFCYLCDSLFYFPVDSQPFQHISWQRSCGAPEPDCLPLVLLPLCLVTSAGLLPAVTTTKALPYLLFSLLIIYGYVSDLFTKTVSNVSLFFLGLTFFGFIALFSNMSEFFLLVRAQHKTLNKYSQTMR